MVYLVLEFLVIPSLLSLLSAILPRPLTETELNVVFFVINFCSILAIFHRFLWQSLLQTKNRIWHCLRYAFLGFLSYELISYLLTLGIVFLHPGFANVNDQAIAGMAQENFFLLSLCTVLLVPVTEECLFRGIFFVGFQKCGRFAAYAVSSLFFAFIHVVGYVGSFDILTLLLCCLQYLPAGLCLCWAYEKSDSIFAPILMHMTINQLGIFSMR